MQATRTSTVTSQMFLTTHYLHFLPLGTQEPLGLVFPNMSYFVMLRGSQDVEDQGQLVDKGL